MEEAEEWRDIPEFEDCYQASSLGRMRSLSRIIPRKDGKIHHIQGRILAMPISKTKKKYASVSITHNGKKYAHNVQNWVLRAFVGSPPVYGDPPREMVACHISLDSLDNRPENLFWATHKDNSVQMRKDGTSPNANKTHCPHGHEYTEENTRININAAGQINRFCRECQRILNATRYNKTGTNA